MSMDPIKGRPNPVEEGGNAKEVVFEKPDAKKLPKTVHICRSGQLAIKATRLVHQQASTILGLKLKSGELFNQLKGVIKNAGGP
ncbi:MAG: hypothetical protein Q8K75_02960 [Chlamydiales bacterium]|nr:hypothetical protein [Chlamydiales bacterium]